MQILFKSFLHVCILHHIFRIDGKVGRVLLLLGNKYFDQYVMLKSVIT